MTEKNFSAQKVQAGLVDDLVGRNLRKRRADLGLTQHDVAKHLSISYQQVQKYETGANRISAGVLYQLAGMLDIEIQDFFEGDVVPAKKMEHGGNRRGSLRIVKYYSAIKDTHLRASILQLMKNIAGEDSKK